VAAHESSLLCGTGPVTRAKVVLLSKEEADEERVGASLHTLCRGFAFTMPSTLTVSDRHRLAIQSFVGRPLGVQDSDQRHDEMFDELRVVAHEAVELRAGFAGQAGLRCARYAVRQTRSPFKPLIVLLQS
jgi:hypothetical protein